MCAGQSKINYAVRDHEYRKRGPPFLEPKKMKFFPTQDMARRLNFLFSRSRYAKVFHHFLTLRGALLYENRRPENGWCTSHIYKHTRCRRLALREIEEKNSPKRRGDAWMAIIHCVYDSLWCCWRLFLYFLYVLFSFAKG